MNTEIVNPKRNRILWAVDPTQEAADSTNLVKVLKTWAKHLNCEVQPISVFSKSIMNLPLDLPFIWKEEYKHAAKQMVSQQLKKSHANGFLPPEILFVPWISTRKTAVELAKYAEREHIQLIFANTRARKTWNPFRLGGFAETLITYARTPVLLVNPDAKPSDKIPSILFPTDFSRESRKALTHLEPWAKAFHSKVLLYNQIENSLLMSSDLKGLGEAVSLQLLREDLGKLRNNKAKTWAKRLKDHGIDSSPIIKQQSKYLAREIVETATKNHVGLIALASHRGPTSQAILGGVARDVLLKAKCPVLIFYRPKETRHHVVNRRSIVKTAARGRASEQSIQV